MIGETMNSNERKNSTAISDITSLVKAVVLIANVLPVFTGFWLALYFTNTSLAAHWDTLLLTLIGSTLVMAGALRSEEHTSELQSRGHLVCRLLLEKKNK